MTITHPSRLPLPPAHPLAMLAILGGCMAFFVLGVVALFGAGAPVYVC